MILLKEGDKVIAIQKCGIDKDIDIGTKGIIKRIYFDGDIYIKFDNMLESRYSGSITNPRIKLYKEKITNWKKEMEKK